MTLDLGALLTALNFNLVAYCLSAHGSQLPLVLVVPAALAAVLLSTEVEAATITLHSRPPIPPSMKYLVA